MANRRIILAIDDDPVVLSVYTSLLTPEYDLRISKSAAEAEILMNKNVPDIILLDIEMPDISGFEFLHTIKRDPKFMNVPVVVVSGHHDPAFIEHAEKGGASFVVAKPVNKDDLSRTINEAFTKPQTGIFRL